MTLADGRSYVVISVRGCKVIEGEVPVSDFCALVKAWESLAEPGDPWIVDSLLAGDLHATFVIGPTSACQQWRAERGLGAAHQPE